MIKLNDKDFNSLYVCMSLDRVITSITGVYFDKIDEKTCNIVALDGRRMFVLSIGITKENKSTIKQLDKKIIKIPNKSLLKKDTVIQYKHNKIELIYNFGTSKCKTVITEEIKEKFPNYKLFLPNKTQVVFYQTGIDCEVIDIPYNQLRYNFVSNTKPVSCTVINDDEEHGRQFVFMQILLRSDLVPTIITEKDKEIKQLKEKIRILENSNKKGK